MYVWWIILLQHYFLVINRWTACWFTLQFWQNCEENPSWVKQHSWVWVTPKEVVSDKQQFLILRFWYSRWRRHVTCEQSHFSRVLDQTLPSNMTTPAAAEQRSTETTSWRVFSGVLFISEWPTQPYWLTTNKCWMRKRTTVPQRCVTKLHVINMLQTGH